MKKTTQIFLSTLKLSACTFGGGFVIVALMRRRFVEELGWLDERQMLDMTAIAQSAPGAIAVNASVLIGHYIAGIPGAAAALLGAVLPPLAILSAVSAAYEAFAHSAVVSMVLSGLLAGVAAVIADVVLTMAHGFLAQRGAAGALALLAALVLAQVLSAGPLLLLFGAAGAMSAIAGRRRAA